MLFSTCKNCSRPLSEGAVARGEAFQTNSGLICSNCKSVKPPQSPEAPPAGALSHYDNAVWSCETCGIPVNALDFIEGRAAKLQGQIICQRCSKTVAPQPQASPEPPQPAIHGRIPPQSRSVMPGVSYATARRMPQRTTSNQAEFAAKAEAEAKKPVLPVVLFAIILPMFAVSLYFAVVSQQQLNDMRLQNSATEAVSTGWPEQARKLPKSQPRTKQPRPENLVQVLPPKPEPKPARETPIKPETTVALAELELELAARVNTLLESDDLADVWEGLIQAGSQRLIACRPWVRRLLADQNDNTRALSAHVCGLLSDELALPKLNQMAQEDSSSRVRVQARKARARLLGKATRELSDFDTNELKKLLEDLTRELGGRKPND